MFSFKDLKNIHHYNFYWELLERFIQVLHDLINFLYLLVDYHLYYFTMSIDLSHFLLIFKNDQKSEILFLFFIIAFY